MTDWVLVARLVRPQGRKGEIIADILTDFPHRFAAHPRVFLRDASVLNDVGKLPREATIERHWLHQGRIVFKFRGIDSINDADPLRGLEVVIPPEERMALEQDAVYIGDLVGCMVIDLTGGLDAEVGEILDVERGIGGSPDLLVVRPVMKATPATQAESDAPDSLETARPRRGKRAKKPPELLIPFAKKYIVAINVANRRVEMRLPAGLTELNADGATPSPEHDAEGEDG